MAGCKVENRIISSQTLPFGGVKQSGLGREGSHHGVEGFLDLSPLQKISNLFNGFVVKQISRKGKSRAGITSLGRWEIGVLIAYLKVSMNDHIRKTVRPWRSRKYYVH